MTDPTPLPDPTDPSEPEPTDPSPAPAGAGISDQEMLEQVAGQTSSDIKYADVFKREADGTTTDTEAAKASADELAGEGREV